ncbi:lipopolysaccharide transport periplasmic protein LptA [Limoniibacter endophyticus]|uniref:Organic solvent tolerance-like N-terminal domain-containing protein n=1 Tax=Limoniibacter endophyticus TaxID=1565040 RepID=A0A8J3DSH9_9HYPH|nr:lipopolysaccharide transport periplasmic protein LptA [Limoniibacter endophyticus]GHC79941.1 hypothetical protein GCM10010136_32690 [Limoniibacter endophyticus]
MQKTLFWNKHSAALFGLLLILSTGTMAYAQQSRSGLADLNLSGDQPIEIESDRLEVRDAERVAVFSGNVQATQGPTVMRAGRMVVHYRTEGADASTSSQGGNIERLEVEQKVYVKSENRVATGDRATFDMATEVLIMTGEKVVLSEGDNVLTGCKLTIQMNSGKADLEGCKSQQSGSGRVRMLLQPGSQNQ